MRGVFSAVTIALIFAILIVALAASGFVLLQHQRLKPEDHAVAEVTRMQNGFLAMNDVVRADEAVEAVLLTGHMNGPEGKRLQEAASFLFARTEALRDSLGDTPTRTGLQTIEAMRTLFSELDTMMATPDAVLVDPERTLTTIQNTTKSLIAFYDHQEDRQHLAFKRQKHLLKQLVNTSLVLILTFMIVASAAVFF